MINRAILLFLLLQVIISPQPFGTGALIERELYANSPLQAPLMRGSYIDLPKAVSLKQYSPVPGNQGRSGTCAGWATAYACRTMLDGIKYGWDKSNSTDNAYSPSFVYNLIRAQDNCEGGASIVDALNVLKDQGGVKINSFAYDCDRKVEMSDLDSASRHKIVEYRLVASYENKNQTMFVKKSLAERKPVVLVMDIPESFFEAGEFWMPDSSEYETWGNGHAMGIVGYDDSKNGGSFEIINSWGTSWGKDGYTWMRYSDFDFFSLYAFELIDVSIKDPNRPDLSGTILFRESNGKEMKADFNGSYFFMEKAYPSGTLFELFVSNNEPAYLYVFSSDLTGKITKVFPYNDRMVAYLPYSQNDIVIPDEESYNMLDETEGKTYFCFLYSKARLDIDKVLSDIEKLKGGFYERVRNVLRDEIIDFGTIELNYEKKISFSSKGNKNKLIPIVIEIEHKNK